MGEGADVLVVGAGLAGLYAARTLHRAGLRVLVLEARDRVGGRTWSLRLEDGTCVDLGGQWIGPGQRRVRALAQEFGLATVETHRRGEWVAEVEGHLRRARGVLPPLSWPALVDALLLSWRLARLAGKLPIAEPWRHAQAHRLDGVSFAAWLQEKTYSREARRYWRYLVESGTCASAELFSPLEIAQQIACIGGLGALESAEQAFFVGGAQDLALRLAEDLGDRVRLQTPVRELRQGGSGVRALTDRGEFCGRRAVLAVPPQMLAAMAMDPALSRECQRRFRSLVPGQVIKGIAVYERAWWRDLGQSGMAAVFAGPITSLVDGSGESGEPGVLVALATGPHAGALGQMDGQARKEVVLAHVQRLLGRAPSPPGHFLSADWTAEPWSRGGYAARRATGGWTEVRDAWTAPCGPVHFAGTETATEWRSYMEGALQSGERASAQVLDAMHR